MSVSRRCLSISERSEFAVAEMFETADDDQLVAAAKDGNRDAFSELVRCHTDKPFLTGRFWGSANNGNANAISRKRPFFEQVRTVSSDDDIAIS
jgi:hypothetical protein